MPATVGKHEWEGRKTNGVSQKTCLCNPYPKLGSGLIAAFGNKGTGKTKAGYTCFYLI